MITFNMMLNGGKFKVGQRYMVVLAGKKLGGIIYASQFTNVGTEEIPSYQIQFDLESGDLQLGEMDMGKYGDRLVLLQDIPAQQYSTSRPVKARVQNSHPHLRLIRSA